MHRTLAAVLISLAALSLAAPAIAQQSTWLGTVSVDWHDPANWDLGVPHPGIDALVQPAPFAPDVGPQGMCLALTVQPGATLQVGPTSSVLVFGDLDVQGSIAGGGTLLLQGTGTVSSAPASPLPAVVVGGTGYTLLDATMASLDHRLGSGPLTIDRAVVLGDANLLGDTLTLAQPTSELLVGGSLTLQTAQPVVNVPGTIACGGDWTSSGTFQPGSGTVRFDGTGTSNVTLAPATSYFNLTISGPSTFTTASDLRCAGLLLCEGTLVCGGGTLDVGGNLQIAAGGQAQAPAPVNVLVGGNLECEGALTFSLGTLDATGDVTVRSTGTLSAGVGPHVFAGDLTVDSGGTLTIATPSTVRFIGSGVTVDVAAPNNFGNVTVEGASVTLASAVIAGDLTLTAGAGTLTIDQVTVAGSTTLQGSSLVLASPTSVLECDGPVVIDTGAPTTNVAGTIRVAGDFTCNVNFQPASGVVVFDATGPQSLTLAPTTAFHRVTVETAAICTTAQNVVINSALVCEGRVTINGGTLIVAGNATIHGRIDVAGGSLLRVGRLTVGGIVTVPSGRLEAGDSVTVETTGSMTLDTGPHVLAGDLTVQPGGTLTLAGASTVRLVGTTPIVVDVAAPSTLHHLSVEAADVTLTRVVLAGDLTQTASAGVLLCDQVVVAGATTLQGQTVRLAIAASDLDCGQSLTFGTSGVCTDLPGTIRVAGNFTCNGNFQPASGVVVFDAAGPQFVVLATTTRFRRLTVATGSLCTTAQDLRCDEDLVCDGSLSCSGSAVFVAGRCAVGTAGTMVCAPASFDCQGDMDCDGAWSCTGPTVHVGGRCDIGPTGAMDCSAAWDCDGDFDCQGTWDCDGPDADWDSTCTVAAGALCTAPNATSCRVGGTLTCDGTFQCDVAALDCDDVVLVSSGGVMLCGTGPHLLRRNLTVAVGGSLNLASASTVRLVGTTPIVVDVAAPSTLHHLSVEAADVTLTRVVLAGDLTQTASAGVLLCDQVVVAGATTLQGQTVRLAATTSDCDCNGDVTFGTLSLCDDMPGTFRCGGHWICNDNFQPASGVVVFDGPGVRTLTLTATAHFRGLRIEVPAVVLTANDLRCTGDLRCDGSLTCTAAQVLVGGRCDIGPAGSLACTPADFDCGGPYVCDGTMTCSGSSVHLRDTCAIGASGSVDCGPATWRCDSDYDCDGAWDCDGTTADWNGDCTVATGAVCTAPNATSCRIVGDFLCDGVWQSAVAALDAASAVTLGPASAVTLGVGPHVFGGDLTVEGSLTVPPATRFQLQGSSGTLSSNFVTLLPFIEQDNLYRVRDVRAEEYLQQPGASTIIERLHLLRSFVARGSSFSGGVPGAELHCEGGVDLQTTAPVTDPPPVFRCMGNWTSNANFRPASGTVEFDGSSAQTVTVDPAMTWWGLSMAFSTASVLFNEPLRATDTVTVRRPTVCNGIEVDVGGFSLEAGGSFTAPNALLFRNRGFTSAMELMMVPQAAFDAWGNATFGPTSALTLGPGPHLFQGDLTVEGSLTVPPTTRFRLLGAGTMRNHAGAPMPRIEVVGTYEMSDVHCTTCEQLPGAGRMMIMSMSLGGEFLARGHSIEGRRPISGVVVLGDVTLETQTLSSIPPLLMTCGGNLTVNDQFAPASGVIEMSGTGQLISTVPAPAMLWDLTVATTGSTTLSPRGVRCFNDLTVTGTMDASSASLFVDGSCTVDPSGRLQIGPGGIPVSLARDLANQGAIQGARAVSMTGTGTLTGAGTFGMDELRIDAGSGTVTVAGPVSLSGGLTLLAGDLQIGAGDSLVVAGGTSCTGGRLTGDPAGTLDLGGAVTLAGTVAGPTLPQILFRSDWSSDSRFQPAGGVIAYAGAGQARLQGIAPLRDPTFATLEVRAGALRAGDPGGYVLRAGSLSVGNGATLQMAAGDRLTVDAPTFDVDGRLFLVQDTILALTPTSVLDVGNSGALETISLTFDPAQITGTGGGGFSLTIAGTLAARNAVFSRMGPAGIRLLSSAVLAPAPDDLRFCTFADGSPLPGSCLLDVARTIPVEIRGLTLESSTGTPFGLRSLTTGPIRVVNAAGNRSGSAFEDDPNNIIDWVNEPPTEVSSFTATGGIQKITLSFTTTRETDLAFLRVLRSTSATGPFFEIAGSPIVPLGSPTAGASYTLVDAAVMFPTRYFYELHEETWNGQLRPLATARARPWPAQVGNTWFVGQGGYPDIQSAISAAPPGGIILVAAGTYPAFTLQRGMIIAADGSGPVFLDTNLGKVVLRDMPATDPDVSLYGLRIGGSNLLFGMEVVNCDNIVVLDEVQVTTGNLVDGLLIDDCPRVVLQACTLVGDPGLRVRNASVVAVQGGAVDELVVESAARVTHAGLVPGSTTVAAGAVAQSLPGSVPRLSFPVAWPGGKPVTIQLTGDPFDFWFLLLAFGKGYTDVSAFFPIDMLLLLDPGSITTLGTGLLSATGTHSIQLIVPDNPGAWGLGLPLQTAVIRGTGTGRFGNVRDLVFLP